MRLLEYSANLQYLGVILNKRLNIHQHVVNKAKKCNYLLHKVKNVIRQEWGLTPSRLAWIWMAIIRPRLTYGSVVWVHKATTTSIDNLDKVQRKALVAATHCLRSTPKKAMEIIFGLPPLDLFLQEIAMKTWFRIQPLLRPTWDGVGDGGTIVGHQRRWGQALQKINTTKCQKTI